MLFLYIIYCLCCGWQLLRHVTIASGGVLPKIHPELLAKKKGGKFITGANTPVTVPYKKPIATKPPIHKKVINMMGCKKNSGY